MDDVQSEFEQRAGRIAVQGFGLSVDVYQPDLFDLDGKLQRQGLRPQYYEVFQAPVSVLRSVRRRLTGRRLACHGEGFWITQPYWADQNRTDYLGDIAEGLRVLESPWLTIECASKQMAGLSFGTYLPPLYTRAGALVAADNWVRLQQSLDESFRDDDLSPPLLLLEIAPLTYFHCGSLPIPYFFSVIAGRTPCGLVLDIGHLWTIYRYSGAWRRGSLEYFLAQFLPAYPLERVVQIHVAGLAIHAAGPMEPIDIEIDGELPRWIDSHGAPIPPVLYEMLEQVLATRRLPHLKGVALEVDTKDINLIAAEFASFWNRFGGVFTEVVEQTVSVQTEQRIPSFSTKAANEARVSASLRTEVQTQYEEYADLVIGRADLTRESELTRDTDVDGLRLYQKVYLPQELLHWGGDLRDMFPDTYRKLRDRAIDVRDFVGFWFARPRMPAMPYDFFLLKIECFVEFVAVVVPEAGALVSREAMELRAAYESANGPTQCEEMAE